MLEGFYCPDGVEIPLRDCLRECRLGDRCQEEPDLVAISREREWQGVASTTQLLNGTMLEFLKLTKPYYVDPDSRAFMLQGTKHHQELDTIAKELGLASEIAMSIDRDIFDLLAFHGKKLCLVDRKMWGSFRIAKALGIVEVGKKPHPTEVYKSSGKWGKEGTPKMIPEFGIDPSKADNWEAELQLNRYRVMLAEKTGLKVDEMYLRVLARDGGLYVAKQRGVDKNTYKISVKMLPNEQVLEYFKFKDDCLKKALADNLWELPCSPQESWDGVRCAEFCDVWNYCPKGILVRSIGGKE